MSRWCVGSVGSVERLARGSAAAEAPPCWPGSAEAAAAEGEEWSEKKGGGKDGAPWGVSLLLFCMACMRGMRVYDSGSACACQARRGGKEFVRPTHGKGMPNWGSDEEMMDPRCCTDCDLNGCLRGRISMHICVLTGYECAHAVQLHCRHTAALGPACTVDMTSHTASCVVETRSKHLTTVCVDGQYG